MPDLFEDVARRWKDRTSRRAAGRIDDGDVRAAYARWAPVYDRVFGAALDGGRRAAVATINALPAGRVLECGVGTGLSLASYRRDHRITGIDLSPDMLDVARRRVREGGLDHVEALEEADAGDLVFETGRFDASVAMFVMTVVPDPKAVMAELIRVTRPGGRVVIVSHFAADRGWRKWIEDAAAPFASALGWHSDFPMARILGREELRLVEERRVGPIGFFTLVVFERL